MALVLFHCHSHSIINGSRKSAWLKGLAVIDMGLYRRFYRQKNTPFAGAGLRGIGSSSISFNHTEQGAELQPLALVQYGWRLSWQIATGKSTESESYWH